MPNWCQNKMTITNFTPEFLATIKKVVEEKKENFFGTFCPIEKDDNWYDERMKLWGTKWDVSIPHSDISSDSIYLIFDTAWCPPLEFYQFLKETHGCFIEAEFQELGSDVAGLWIDGGESVCSVSDAKEYCVMFDRDDHPYYCEEAELREGGQMFFNDQFIGVLINKYEWLPVGKEELACCVANEKIVGVGGADLDELGIDY